MVTTALGGRPRPGCSPGCRRSASGRTTAGTARPGGARRRGRRRSASRAPTPGRACEAAAGRAASGSRAGTQRARLGREIRLAGTITANITSDVVICGQHDGGRDLGRGNQTFLMSSPLATRLSRRRRRRRPGRTTTPRGPSARTAGSAGCRESQQDAEDEPVDDHHQQGLEVRPSDAEDADPLYFARSSRRRRVRSRSPWSRSQPSRMPMPGDSRDSVALTDG